MVTEPEPGFVSLVDRLEEVKHFLMTEWELAADDGWPSRAGHIADLLATLGDAIEALQMEDGSSQGLKPAVSGGREDAPTWRPIETHNPTDDDEAVLVSNGYTSDIAWIAWRENGRPVYYNGNVVAYPTHWQPLPAPPTEEPKT